jgi:selenocysteine-specific elongation factor
VSIAGFGRVDIQPGTRASVRIRLETPAALTRGDRFIVRAYSPTVTVGGGEVLDPEPPRAGVRTAAGEQRFAALTQDENRALAQMVSDSEGHGLPLAALTSRAGVAPPRIESVVGALVKAGCARRVGDRLVDPAVIRDLSARLLTMVGEFHKAQPLADGLPREEARERVFARAHPAVFEDVLAELAAGGRLSVRDRLALPGHRLELSPEEARAHELIEAAYARAGLKPPDAATLAAEGRLSPALVEKMTSLLLRQKVLARVDTLVFHVETLNALKGEVRALKSSAPNGRATVDVATFKDRYGVTRKFAIPLLEWLDRERVTRRMGDTRVVL